MSRPWAYRQIRRSRSAAGLIVLVLSTAACWPGTSGPAPFGPVADEGTAIEAALQMTDLEGPVDVVAVVRGRAGDVVWTPGGLFADEASAARDRARRNRDAWGVTLRGMAPSPCDREPCPLVETRQDLAIDVATGELLFVTLGGAFDDAPNLDRPAPPSP